MFAQVHDRNVRTSTGSSLQGAAPRDRAGSPVNSDVRYSTNSLGSSPGGGSSAENWFNNCNNNVQNAHRSEFTDSKRLESHVLDIAGTDNYIR
jgi:hypothetical protein